MKCCVSCTHIKNIKKSDRIYNHKQRESLQLQNPGIKKFSISLREFDIHTLRMKIQLPSVWNSFQSRKSFRYPEVHGEYDLYVASSLPSPINATIKKKQEIKFPFFIY